MILRDAIRADGSPCWVLILQTDHAHLAGELAEKWVEEIPCREIALPTIYRHDDGWREWDSAPQIDPATGHPRSFLEMPNPIAHEIWRKSIDSVADLGPLAQYMVAEHFCRLRRNGEANDEVEVQAFLSEYDKHGRQWLAQWQGEDPARNTLAQAARAVDWLQFFDLFSLWLCMAERTRPDQLAWPGGSPWNLTPEERGQGDRTIAVEPWPWSSPSRQLQARGRQIAAQPLPTDFALRGAISSAVAVELSWRFEPGSSLRHEAHQK